MGLRRRPVRRGHALPTALATVFLSLLIGPVPAGAGIDSVTVTLSMSGPTQLAQGLPFTVKATATNPDPQPATVRVDFEISFGGGVPVDASAWSVIVPALGSAKTKFSVTPSQWFADVGTYQVVPQIDGQPAGSPLSLDVLAPTVPVPVFEDVTQAAGLSTTLPGPVCSRFAAGAAWGDANGDGLLDLYVPNSSGAPSQLWIQDVPGHFTDQAAERGVDDGDRIGMGAVFADFNNDGYEDLYVVNDGPNRLYQNDGTGHFTDVGPHAGVADAGAGPSAAWGDYDNDGYLDLYVVNYQDCVSNHQPDKLYHNDGDGTFTDVTYLLGPADATTGPGYQAAWFDYNHDGYQDLYLANDKLSQNQPGNHLWRNDGPGNGGTWTFTDVSAESGTNWVMASMGIGIADFDRDLDLDFALSNIQGNRLARNNGDGTFTDVASSARVARPFQNADLHSITWGLGFYDFNLDGWEDLYVAAGPISGADPQPNELFVSDGRGKFLDLSALSGAADPGMSRGVAFADYDGDGLMDMYVVDEQGSPILYHNVTSTGGMHWLEVRAQGTVSNRDGCGARLTLTVGTDRLLREVFCGSVGLASGSDRTVLFGLGTASTASRLVIDWPSGTRQILQNIAANQQLTVVEP